MKLQHHYKSKIYLAFFFLSLISCTPKTEDKETADENNKPDREAGITLTKSQLDAVGIAFGSIEKKNLKSVVKASGQLEVPPQNRAEVTLLLGGLIKQVFVLEGQHVNKGQKLAAVENNQVIQLQQEYMSASSSLVFASREYERQRELNAANAGVGKNFQQSESNYRSEQSRVAALARQLQQLGLSPASASKGRFITQMPVLAPISGTIGKINIQTGSYAEPARPLMNIVDNSKVHCDLVVYEKDLFKVQPGQLVNFILTNQNNREISGTIYGVNQSFENDSKAIIAHAVIEQAAKNNLIQGMYVSALINVGKQLVSAVPTEAIVKSGGKEYIYFLKKTQGNNYVFDQAEVVSGVADLGYTEISLVSTLPENVNIVTRGAYYILSSQNASGDEH